MRPCWIVPFFVVALAAVVPPPVSGQARAVDVRALAGLAVGLDDTPPHARLGGGTVTVARGPRSRMGFEVLLADLFGPYAVIEKARRAIHRDLGVRFRARPAREPIPGRRSRLDAAPTAHSQPRALLRSVAPRVPVGHAAGHPRARRRGSPAVDQPARVPRSGSPYRSPRGAFDGRGRLRLRALIRPGEAASVGGENWTRDRIGCDRGQMVVHERLDAAARRARGGLLVARAAVCGEVLGRITGDLLTSRGGSSGAPPPAGCGTLPPGAPTEG